MRPGECGHDPKLRSASTESCQGCERREIPKQAVFNRETPAFTASTVPPALLKEHHTTVWARLVVESGQVTFTERSGWTATADPSNPVVIVPDQVHSIRPSADALFKVQFFDVHRDPSGDGDGGELPGD